VRSKPATVTEPCAPCCRILAELNLSLSTTNPSRTARGSLDVSHLCIRPAGRDACASLDSTSSSGGVD